MNLFSRIWFAAVFPFLNRYDATQYSTDRSWRQTPLQDSRLDLSKCSREVLQAKSRDWERNSELYRKLANLWEQYTVGTGIRLASASSDPEWNKVADEVFENWAPVADLQSRFGWYNNQGVISRARMVDGEHFVILTSEGVFPRIQLIEAHNCQTPEQHKSREGISIIDGVEVDNNKRPTGYWFKRGDDTFAKVDASFVIHVMNPERASQYRGIPEYTAALNTIHDLWDLKILEMRANKDAAELSTIYKTATGEMPTALGKMRQAFNQASTVQGTPTSTPSTATETKREYYKTARGGSNIVLFTGDDVVQHIPERPGANTREYWRLLAGEVCAAGPTPLALVYPDSMQGTVYRGALDAAAASYRNETAVFAGYFARVRNYVLETEMRFNKALAQRPKDWKKVTAGTVRAPNVDIGRNSQAMLAEIKGGTRTFCSSAAELGLDGKQLLTEKAAEVALIRELAKANGVLPTDISDLLTEEQPQPAATPTTE